MCTLTRQRPLLPSSAVHQAAHKGLKGGRSYQLMGISLP